MDYISVPSDPVWNYNTDEYGTFTHMATGSINFDLHPSEEVELVLGILKYAGVIIKDPSILQMASQEEAVKTNLEN